MKRMKAARATAWEAAGSRGTHVPHPRMPECTHLTPWKCSGVEKASETAENRGREGPRKTDPAQKA